MSFDISRVERVRQIIPKFVVGEVSTTKTVKGPCTINVLSGTAWVRPGTSVAISTGIELTGAIDMVIPETLALISDVNGAEVQIIAWG